jgi:DNA gyrase/topoisomerase IV subunit A
LSGKFINYASTLRKTCPDSTIEQKQNKKPNIPDLQDKMSTTSTAALSVQQIENAALLDELKSTKTALSDQRLESADIQENMKSERAAISEQRKMELAAIKEDRKLKMKALSEQHEMEVVSTHDKLNEKELIKSTSHSLTQNVPK